MHHIRWRNQRSRPMKITIKAFNREKHFDIAIDEDTGAYLVGIPFNMGPAEHTNYYGISKEQFELGVSDPGALGYLVDGQRFHGSGGLYFSTASKAG